MVNCIRSDGGRWEGTLKDFLQCSRRTHVFIQNICCVCCLLLGFGIAIRKIEYGVTLDIYSVNLLHQSTARRFSIKMHFSNVSNRAVHQILGISLGVDNGIAERGAFRSSKTGTGVPSQTDTVLYSRSLNKFRKRWWSFASRGTRRSRCLHRSDDPVLATRAVVLGLQLQVGFITFR